MVPVNRETSTLTDIHCITTLSPPHSPVRPSVLPSQSLHKSYLGTHALRGRSGAGRAACRGPRPTGGGRSRQAAACDNASTTCAASAANAAATPGQVRENSRPRRKTNGPQGRPTDDGWLCGTRSTDRAAKGFPAFPRARARRRRPPAAAAASIT